MSAGRQSIVGLASLNLPSVLNSSDADITNAFFVPALEVSLRYDRGVGYFSAAWLSAAAKGMAAFARNGGRARWVTSPILSEEDWHALQLGQAARYDEVLRRTLQKNLDDLERTLREETLSALAWLVADGILDFQLALPRNRLERGEFHDKFGIFTDAQENQVSFNGSYNDSLQATHNYESIKVFPSWQPAFAGLVRADIERFEQLWSNLDPNVQVFKLPDAALARIVRLRTQDRPYPEPAEAGLRRIDDVRSSYQVEYAAEPRVPLNTTLRPYQLQAIAAWFANNGRGLLEMATGTGKTITALAASARLFGQERQLAVIVAVPFQHLVDQWSAEAYSFGYRPVLAYQGRNRWLDDLNAQIVEYNAGYRRFISVIATHSTFISREFQASIARLRKPSLLIADEAHHLGAERSRQSYPQQVSFRLALSATPSRWFDHEGTDALDAYFGGTVFSFSLEKAIGVSLVPYYYYPHLVPLTVEELEAYEGLSAKIARVMNRDDDRGRQLLRMLLIQRARLLNTAEDKLRTLSELVDQQGVIRHALFYCAPRQIDAVLRILGWEKGLLIHRFTAMEGASERQRLLADFGGGDLQALVAMKCLDEGVDVPETRTAFILASSSNPREFIQRRGRILRRAPGKDHAVIHDLIAVPPAGWMDQDSATFRAERSIMRRELRRFREFAGPALNKHQALDAVWQIAARYGLMDF